MGSGLGVGEDTAATVGSGAAAGVSVGRGVVATSGWRGVSWDCIRSDRSACGAAVGPATDGGSCPAVHAAKINEASRAAAISLDILWALSFNSLQPGIPHEAGVAFSARDPQPSEPPDALAHSPDGELPGRPGSPEIVVVDDGPPESAPGPASPGVVAGGVVADGELAPVGPPEGDVVLRDIPAGADGRSSRSTGGCSGGAGRRSGRGRGQWAG